MKVIMLKRNVALDNDNFKFNSKLEELGFKTYEVNRASNTNYYFDKNKKLIAMAIFENHKCRYKVFTI